MSEKAMFKPAEFYNGRLPQVVLGLQREFEHFGQTDTHPKFGIIHFDLEQCSNSTQDLGAFSSTGGGFISQAHLWTDSCITIDQSLDPEEFSLEYQIANALCHSIGAYRKRLENTGYRILAMVNCIHGLKFEDRKIGELTHLVMHYENANIVTYLKAR